MEDILKDNWIKTINDFNQGKKQFSSEKSLVFWYAWNLKSSNPELIEEIDFERSLFVNFSDGTFLDLYLVLKSKNKNLRVGIEFKLPHNNGGNTNQTQTRQKCINDLKRLNWLVTKNRIDLGIFLMATDEGPYTNKGKYRKAIEFETYDGKEYQKNDLFPINELSSDSVEVISDQQFIWNNFEKIKNRIEIPKDQFAWIEPIIIKNTQ
jgi:hypothetical protein